MENESDKTFTPPEDDSAKQIREEELAINPGDKDSGEIAVDAPDITGDEIKIPTHFIVDDPDGEQRSLHHVKDAEEISDVIRQARIDEDGNQTWR